MEPDRRADPIEPPQADPTSTSAPDSGAVTEPGLAELMSVSADEASQADRDDYVQALVMTPPCWQCLPNARQD